MNIKHAAVSLVLLTGALLAAASCLGPKTARDYADKKGLTYGVSVQAGDVLDPKAIALIRTNFNLMVPENTMKWSILRPTKTFWNWSDMDAMVAFAQKYKMKMKGHTFVWYQQNPPYVDGLKTRDEAIALLTEQITTVMTRYKGKIYEYDVANETLNEDGSMRETVWYKIIGPDYLDIAFRAARAADPKARLILNDYNNECLGNPKADAFYALVKGLKERGIPIDGVGFQMHLAARDPFDENAVLANIRRFKELGLFVSFTEIDVRVAVPLTPEKEAEQAAVYSKVMELALTESNTGSFIMWGYTDKHSWIPGAFPGFGFAHVFDREVKAKPLCSALVNLMKNAPRRSAPRG